MTTTGPEPLRVALTGGIAAGKSTAARRFAELGAVVVDHDVLAREVVATGSPGLAAVVATFGPGMLTADGSLDRAALGAVVFADPEARARLDAIVHPLVRAAAAEREARATGAVVVHDIPLLVETGQADRFDVVVTVTAPPEVRVRRLVEGRGLTEDQARGRLAAQAPEQERLAVADVVLDGSGRTDDLVRQVDRAWSERLAPSP